MPPEPAFGGMSPSRLLNSNMLLFKVLRGKRLNMPVDEKNITSPVVTCSEAWVVLGSSIAIKIGFRNGLLGGCGVVGTAFGYEITERPTAWAALPGVRHQSDLRGALDFDRAVGTTPTAVGLNPRIGDQIRVPAVAVRVPPVSVSICLVKLRRGTVDHVDYFCIAQTINLLGQIGA